MESLPMVVGNLLFTLWIAGGFVFLLSLRREKRTTDLSRPTESASPRVGPASVGTLLEIDSDLIWQRRRDEPPQARKVA